jgi:hypothetical protein
MSEPAFRILYICKRAEAVIPFSSKIHSSSSKGFAARESGNAKTELGNLHFKSSSAKASAQTSFARVLPEKIVCKPHLHARFLEKSSATADSHLHAAKLICKPIFVTC